VPALPPAPPKQYDGDYFPSDVMQLIGVVAQNTRTPLSLNGKGVADRVDVSSSHPSKISAPGVYIFPDTSGTLTETARVFYLLAYALAIRQPVSLTPAEKILISDAKGITLYPYRVYRKQYASTEFVTYERPYPIEVYKEFARRLS
jgi:hypothetical protein